MRDRQDTGRARRTRAGEEQLQDENTGNTIAESTPIGPRYRIWLQLSNRTETTMRELTHRGEPEAFLWRPTPRHFFHTAHDDGPATLHVAQTAEPTM